MINKLIWTVFSDYMVFSPVHPYSAKWRLLNILRSKIRDAIDEAKLIITIVIVCKFVVIWSCFLQKKICACVWDWEVGQWPPHLLSAGGKYCYWPGFLASLINRNWSETSQEIQVRLYIETPPAAGGEQEQGTHSLAILFTEKGLSWLFLWGCVQGTCQRGGSGDLPTPLVMLCASGMHSILLLLSKPCWCSWLFRSDSWVFSLFTPCP